MFSFNKIYGETTIQKVTKDYEEDRIINLKYYKTKAKNDNDKIYGVGVIRTEIVNNEFNQEKQEINNICKQKDEVENLLEMLLQNKVTPVDLKYVLEDIE